MTNKFKICHLTSAHPQHDVRIFLKECTSLASHFNTTFLVVNGISEKLNNVNIIGVPVNYSGRIQRFTKAVNAIYRKAKKIDADVYHLHDPELLRIALKLKRLGKKVIYDVHEDFPRQLMSKPYLRKGIIKFLPFIIEKYENYIYSRLNLNITATPFIENRFKAINPNTININNFPLQEEIEIEIHDKVYTNKLICYIGGITKIRGIKQLVEALGKVNGIRLDIAGEISPNSFKEELIQLKGWDKVNLLGFIDRKHAIEIKKNSVAGIVTFLPEPNHVNAQPNKIFEYMASGLPVIGSNFELWKQIIVDNNCGICVDPSDPIAIAAAIQQLIDYPEKAMEMGNNGKRLVKEKYNWNIEKEKLITAYKNLLN